MSDIGDSGYIRKAVAEATGDYGGYGVYGQYLEYQNYIREQAASGDWWSSIDHLSAYADLQGYGTAWQEAKSLFGDDDIDGRIGYLKYKGLSLPAPPQGFGEGDGAGGPSTAEQIDNMMADMRSAALLWNVRIDDGTLRNLATTAVNQNWNRQRVLNGIGAFAVGQDAQNTNLDQGPLGNAVREMAKQYGVVASEATVKQLIQGYVQGTESEQSITAKFQQQAINAYPALAERLRQGETFEQVITPYREVASRVLEKDPAQLDFVNTNLAKAFQNNPDGNGERQMSVGEFSEFLRTNREFGYEYTTQAQTKAYQMANTLAQMFGRA